MEDIVTAKRLRDVLPVFTALATVLLILAVAAALYLGRDIFIPLALAVLLSFVLAPLVQFLQRARVPRGVAAPVVVLIAFLLLIGVGTVIVGQVADLAADLPQYRSTMLAKIKSLRASMEGSGTISRALDVIQDVGAELQDADPAATVPGERPAGPMLVEVREPGAGPFETLGNFVAPVLHPLATTGLILIFAVFMLLQREDLRNRFIRLAGTSDLQKTTAAIDDTARRLSRLFLMQLALNAGFGAAIGLGLWAIGVPSPALWGILAAVLRFVPYIGAVISAVLPMALAVAVDPGWSMLLWSALLFLILEPLAGQVIEPMAYGHSTGLSPIAVLVAAVFWAFLWGPVGLVLATPMTVCLVVLGRHIERLAFLDVLLGDRPALSPPQIFYQRMLAGDPAEAAGHAKEFLKLRALSTYYDEVGLEGLRLAQDDIARGTLSVERQETIRQSITGLVAALADHKPAAGGRGLIGAEAEAAVEIAGPDRPVVKRTPAEMNPEWRGEFPILCVAAHGVLDEGIALMLAQLFDRHGLRTRVVGQDIIASDEPLPPELQGAALICFSYMDALSVVHIRYAARRMRRKLPGARVMVGLWRQRDPATLESLRRATSADVLATSLHEALAGALDLSASPRAKPEPA